MTPTSRTLTTATVTSYAPRCETQENAIQNYRRLLAGRRLLRGLARPRTTPAAHRLRCVGDRAVRFRYKGQEHRRRTCGEQNTGSRL